MGGAWPPVRRFRICSPSRGAYQTSRNFETPVCLRTKFFHTGNLATAISIGGFEVITKLVLYFFHERYWARIRWGIIPGSA